MEILTLIFSVCVVACIIYATLSLAYFYLSQHRAFSFLSSSRQRILFGIVAGVISLGLQWQYLVISGVQPDSFAVLPVILSTLIGGWLSGLISMVMVMANISSPLDNRIAIILIFMILITTKVWRKQKNNTQVVFYITLSILICEMMTPLLSRPSYPYFHSRLVYVALQCLCFYITYFTLVKNNEYVEASIRIRDFAMIDSVTSLNNRKKIDQEILRLASEKQSFGVGLIDLDDFKMVNDRYGHLIGDQALYEIAEIFRGTTRTKDFVGRYGGEEFLIFIRNSDPVIVKLICHRIRYAIASTVFLPDSLQPFKLTVSIGVGMRHAGCDLKACIHQADLALYEAKRMGKNTVVMADDNVIGG